MNVISKIRNSMWKAILVASCTWSVGVQAMQPGACGIQERPSSNSDCAYNSGGGGNSSMEDAGRILQAVGTELKRQEAQRNQQQQQQVTDADKAERYRRRAAIDEERARGLDLSGGCNSAQKKGAEYAKSIEDLSKWGVCESGLKAKLLGIVTVRVAESCQGQPDSQQLLSQGRQLTNEGENTMRSSCSWY